MSLYYRGREYEDAQGGKSRLADQQLLRSLWHLATPVRPLLAGAFLLMLLGAAADLVRPYMMKLAIDTYVAAKDLPGLETLFAVYMATIALRDTTADTHGQSAPSGPNTRANGSPTASC